MSCSTTSPCDDRPIGSPSAADSCSPCQGVSSDDLVSLTAQLLDRVCTLESKMSNWMSLLERARNRLSAAELQIARTKAPAAPPSSVRIDICDSGEVTEADAFSVCLNGEAGLLVLDDCQFPIVKDGKIVGRDYGPTWLSAKVTLLSNIWTSNQSFSMAGYDKPACAKFAIVQLYASSVASSSDGAVYVKAHFPNGLGAQTVFSNYSSSGEGSVTCDIAYIPILDDDTIKLDVTTSGVPLSKSVSASLLGFL